MPALDPVLLDVLACPSADHAPVRVVGDPDDPRELECSVCGTRYPVRDGIPVMLVDEAVPGPAGIGVPAAPRG